MAKYISKSEPISKAASTIIADSINKLRSHSTTATAIRTAMIQSVGNRDFSTQETAHLLLSLPLYTCTYRFVTINLDGGRQIRENLLNLNHGTQTLQMHGKISLLLVMTSSFHHTENF